MAAELDIQDLDGDVGPAVGSLDLSQVERFIDRSHAAESDALFQHEAVVERLADALHPFGLELWLGLEFEIVLCTV